MQRFYLTNDLKLASKWQVIFMQRVFEFLAVGARLRRRIHTEEKAKVVAGTEFVQFLATLATLHKDDWNNRMKCTRMIEEKGEFILCLKSS